MSIANTFSNILAIASSEFASLFLNTTSLLVCFATYTAGMRDALQMVGFNVVAHVILSSFGGLFSTHLTQNIPIEQACCKHQ